MVNVKDLRKPRLMMREEHEKLVKPSSNPTKIMMKREVKPIRHKEMFKELHPKLNVEEIKEEVKKRRGKKVVEVFERGDKKDKKNKKKYI
jgi:hypothetical protein